MNNMKKWAFLLVAPVLFLMTEKPVHALPTSGDTFLVTGIDAATSAKLFDASFTVANQVPLTTLWTVNSFTANAVDCASSCATSWNLSGLLFNATTNSLIGGAVSPIYIGQDGDKKTLVLTFLDGNTANNTFASTDLSNLLKTKTGKFSDPVRAVPEPTSLVLLGFGILAMVGWFRLTQSHQ